MSEVQAADARLLDGQYAVENDPLVVPDQLVADGLPGATEDGAPARFAHAPAEGSIRYQCADRGPQVAVVGGGEEVAVDAVPDEVDGSAGTRGDHRETARVGLLHGLAERLLRSGVHEDVEARVCRRQLLAAEASEHGHGHPAQLLLHDGNVGSVADDRDMDARDAPEALQALDLLLGGDPPDVADDHLAVGGEAFPQCPGRRSEAVVRVVANEIHSASPARQPVDPSSLQVRLRSGGRHQGEVRALVHPAHETPRDG